MAEKLTGASDECRLKGCQYDALRAERAKLEAAHRWRDMNSAPYDKTTVALLLVDGNYRRYGVGWYMPLEGWQGWRKDGDYRGPTHWSPLPADLPLAQPAESGATETKEEAALGFARSLGNAMRAGAKP